MAIIVRNCGFPKLETHGSKPEKVTLPVEGSVDCKKLDVMVLNVVLFCLLSRSEPFVLLNGPVKNALFCLMDRYQNVCVWFMARNCRFPKVGTHGCQRGNHRLPLQGTAGSQRLELMVPNLGTRGYHCKQLPVPRGWNSCFPTWEP